jgi:hypothetical protein
VGDVILAESASLAKRKAEVAEEAAARKEAKRHRLELKTRGHQVSAGVSLDGRVSGCVGVCVLVGPRGGGLLLRAMHPALLLPPAELETGLPAGAAAACGIVPVPLACFRFLFPATHQPPCFLPPTPAAGGATQGRGPWP